MEKNSPLNKIITLSFGHITAKCAMLAAELNLHGILQEQSMSVEEIAHRFHFTVEGTRKFLRILGAFDFIHFSDDKASAAELTPYLDYLLGIHIRDGYKVIDELSFSLEQGQPAWEKVYGQNFYEYLKSQPHKLESFAIWCKKTLNIWLSTVLNLYDFSKSKVIADIGGGNGELLLTILKAYHDTRGILFDLPLVVEQARKAFAGDEVNERMEFAGGNFFESIPSGKDLYLICRTLLNWNDHDAVKIINRCYEAMKPNGKLLIIDFVLPEANHPSYQRAVLSDLNLYTIFSSANRTQSEWIKLVSKSDFSGSFTYRCNSLDFHAHPDLIMPICVIEASKN